MTHTSSSLRFLVALVALSPVAPSSAQPRPTIEVLPAKELLPAPYTNPERSLALLEPLRERSPERIDLHLAAAREGTAIGLTAPDPAARVAWLEGAVADSRRAVALAPDDPEANYWLAASLGLLADQEGGRTKITLAREAYGVALHVLELEPDHGGAHHIVGRLHAGARRLSWVTRMVARGLGLGEVLNEASWASAENHMRIAVREAPDPLVHTFELARLLVETGAAPLEGRALLTELSRREPIHALDAYYIRRARESLAELPP